MICMVLLTLTVTALQTLLEVCHAYARPHDIVFNTPKRVCILVQPNQSQGRYSTRVRLGSEELSFVEEFCYLGHVMTADCRDDNLKKKSIGKMQLAICWSGSSHLHLWRQINPIVLVIL